MRNIPWDDSYGNGRILVPDDRGKRRISPITYDRAHQRTRYGITVLT
jgi:hypothetical protein